MNKYLLFLAMMVLAGCTDHQIVEEVAKEELPTSESHEIDALMEQARRGDGDAYLKLADRYRRGAGVKQDFMGMITMLGMAMNYGGIEEFEDYVNILPADDPYRIAYETMNRYDTRERHKTDSLIRILIDRDCPNGYTVQSVMDAIEGDTIKARSLLNLATEQGSSFAELLQCIRDLQKPEEFDTSKLAALSDRIPLTNHILGSIYAGLEGPMYERNDSLAVLYFLKADEKACLGVKGARWLLGYHQNGGKIPLSEAELQRIRILAKEGVDDSVTKGQEEIEDTDEVDEVIEIIDED